jgi:hypothetical protein
LINTHGYGHLLCTPCEVSRLFIQVFCTTQTTMIAQPKMTMWLIIRTGLADTESLLLCSNITPKYYWSNAQKNRFILHDKVLKYSYSSKRVYLSFLKSMQHTTMVACTKILHFSNKVQCITILLQNKFWRVNWKLLKKCPAVKICV